MKDIRWQLLYLQSEEKGAPYATDSLLSLVGGERTKLTPRELDMIVSVGEVISTAVFTQMLKEMDLMP